MRVEVVKAFRTFSVGHVIPEMPANEARTLIARGLVREVVERRDMPAAPNKMIRHAPVAKARA